MALELTIVVETELPVPFTVADGAGIEKGTLLVMTDPMTAAACTTDNAIIAGVAATEKIASDGITKLGVFRGGIFKATCGAAGCTVGDALISDCSTGDPNEIVQADNASENMLGVALETATDLETFLFELRPWSRKEA